MRMHRSWQYMPAALIYAGAAEADGLRRSIMPIEFIGMLGTNGLSESRLSRGPAIDKAYLP